MAHKDREQLEYLISYFNHPSFKVYLHLDKLADFSYHALKGDFIPLKENYACAWGSYNVVKATFDLLKLANIDNSDYYLLISGQDYPIKNLDYMINFFKNNEGKSYIHSVPFQNYLPEQRIENAYSRLEVFHIPKRFPVNFYEKIKFSFLFRISQLQKKFGFLKLPIPKGLYFGENWFNLHKQLVVALIDSYDKSIFLRLRLSFGCNMEEVLPHTLLSRQPFASFKIISNSLRFTIWNHPSNHPEILKFNDLKDHFDSPALFARKFEDICELIKIKDYIDRA